MGERGKVLQKYGAPVPDVAEVAKWYRAAAEQGFAPAQDSLGQMLGFFPELAREPFEAETWLYRAAIQGEGAAADRLLQAIEIDRARADYRPSPQIQAWLQQRANGGDARADAILDQLGATTQN
jgi:TPR repeat protein